MAKNHLLRPYDKKLKELCKTLELPDEALAEARRRADAAAMDKIKELRWKEQQRKINDGPFKGCVCTNELRDTSTGEVIGYMLQKTRDPNNTLVVLAQNDKNGKKNYYMLTRSDSTGKFSLQQKGKPYKENEAGLRKKVDKMVLGAAGDSVGIDYLREYYRMEVERKNKERDKQQQQALKDNNVKKTLESPKMDNQNKELDSGVAVNLVGAAAGFAAVKQVADVGDLWKLPYASANMTPPSADVTEDKGKGMSLV